MADGMVEDADVSLLNLQFCLIDPNSYALPGYIVGRVEKSGKI
jgi:hypothetical protein